ncbi:YggT family protein [Fusibacter tunisiensis]|jgi:YggT family protein|uniref:YggT family protein n=1 Tax=Fusibacter tunisiensis TaxID=1008308 RepID=A0ABS2MM88_9FIRM|nr:YggT family protein [Fusibacter tunisiensis]MBM7560514.1 YggT family protein [Fusibacter tunisiensis]
MLELRITIYYFLQVIMYLIFARALLSWFIRNPQNPIMSILLALTEPILSPIRALLFKLKIGGNMIDFSPLAALLLVQLLSAMVLGLF